MTEEFKVAGASRQVGFSLIELMVALGIVAILARMAVPLWQTQMRESHRADAKTALLDLASREEKYFANYNAYTASATNLYGTGVSFPISLPGGTQTTTYNLIAPVITAASTTAPPSYQLEADAQGDQANDICGNYLLSSTGAETNVSTQTLPTNCW